MHLFLALIACPASSPPPEPSAVPVAPPATAVAAASAASAVASANVPASGGTVAIDLAGGARAAITFQKGALAAAADVTVASLAAPPAAAEGFVSGAFDVEGATLAAPALVVVELRGEVAEDAAIARFADDGASYEVFDTARVTRAGVTRLAAAVDHFSTYAVITPCAAGSASPIRSATLTDADLPFVLTIDDTATLTNGPMTSTVHIDLNAVSARGIAGPYVAAATSRTTNAMAANGGTLDAPSTTDIPPFEFTFAPAAPEPGRAALQWKTSGSLQLTSTGTGVVTGGGGAAAGRVRSTSDVPYTLSLFRHMALLEVDVGTGATLPFFGFVRVDPEGRDTREFEAAFDAKSHGIKASEVCGAPAGGAALPPLNQWQRMGM